MSVSMITQSLGLFILAGLCEIGGGWLVWQWLRESRSWPWGFIGGLVLILYGVIPTFQPAHFGRVYAAYGGVFIVLSLRFFGAGFSIGTFQTGLMLSEQSSVWWEFASSCTGQDKRSVLPVPGG